MLPQKGCQTIACDSRHTVGPIGAEIIGGLFQLSQVTPQCRRAGRGKHSRRRATGCSGASSNSTDQGRGSGPVKDPSKPVTVTFQSWVGSDPTLKKMAADFHKLHPNITIKMLNVSADSASQKLTTRSGGNPPDVAYVDASDTSDFASRGALVNLDNYMKRSKDVDPADYVNAFKTFVTWNGHMWGAPIDGESTGLFYRKDLFRAARITHPPTTWSQFQADAAKLTVPSKKQYGYEVFASNPEGAYYFYPWLYRAGGDLLGKDGKSVISTVPRRRQRPSTSTS